MCAWRSVAWTWSPSGSGIAAAFKADWRLLPEGSFVWNVTILWTA
jgi:hypothetical protein